MNKKKRQWAAGGVATAVAVVTLALIAGFGSPADARGSLARAVLHDASGRTIGSVIFVGAGGWADTVVVDLRLPADAPALGSFHGLHVHTTGTCVAPFTTAGGHWTLAPATHGSHTGDLPSVLVANNGRARMAFQTHRFRVNQLFDADGSAVVLHAGADNFANVPIGGGKYEDPNNWFNSVDPAGTARTGDAGSRYGCGVVTGV